MRLSRSFIAFALLASVVACGGGSKSDPTYYAVRVSVSGLEGSGLVLQNNGGDDLAVSQNGTWAFATLVQPGWPFAVTVRSEPAAQDCRVTNGTGNMGFADASVVVTCSTVAFSVGGAVTGLDASGLVLALSDGQTVAVPAGATSYAFPNPVGNGTYSVSVQASPPTLSCSVPDEGAILVGGSSVRADVTCGPALFTVGGTLVGLPATNGSITLGLNGTHTEIFTRNGAFHFDPSTQLPPNSPYRVTIVTPPAGRTCTVTRDQGTVGTANVDDVVVSCGLSSFPVGGDVTGLTEAGLRVTSTIPGASAVSVPIGANSYVFATTAVNGTYTITIDAVPAGLVCKFANGTATTTAQVANSAALGANIACESVVLQRWVAPATWGGSATSFWSDADPALVQHARVDASGNVVETKSQPWSYTGATRPPPALLEAFPAGPRYGVGPFPVEGENFKAQSADPRLDLQGAMLVCAVVQPDFDPVADGHERPILSKGIGNATDDIAAGGWSLMQMHESLCFHYTVKDADGLPHTAMAFTPTFSANGDAYGAGGVAARDVASLPNWVVVCAGRDGENLRIAVNSAVQTSVTMPLAPFGRAPHGLDAATGRAATLGGYTEALTQFPGSNHVFRGRIYETAVWSVPATAANMQARMNAVLGLGAGEDYTRNRMAMTVGPTGKFVMTWRHAPRLVSGKGMLFGLQSWNRINSWMDHLPHPMTFAASENLGLWTVNGDASVVADATAGTPTGVGPSADLVTIAPGSSLSLPLNQAMSQPGGPAVTPVGTWDVPGAVHGEIWVRVRSAAAPGATLTVRKDYPDTRPEFAPGRDRYTINLDTLVPGQWTRIWLNGTRGGLDVGGALSTDGVRCVSENPCVPRVDHIWLENTGSVPVEFNAWGVLLTQFAGGGDLNSSSAVPVPFSQPSPDPGPFIYDPSASHDLSGWNAPTYLQEVLQLAPVSGSTVASGFCLSADARPPDGIAWDVRTHASRTALAWADNADPKQVTRVVRLHVNGIDGTPETRNRICLSSRTLATPGDWSAPSPQQEILHACAAIPAWDAGTRHNLRACVAPSGEVAIYADYASGGTTPIAVGTMSDVPDLANGRLLIGNGVNGVSSLSSPWQGFISKAVACRRTDLAKCD